MDEKHVVLRIREYDGVSGSLADLIGLLTPPSKRQADGVVEEKLEPLAERNASMAIVVWGSALSSFLSTRCNICGSSLAPYQNEGGARRTSRKPLCQLVKLRVAGTEIALRRRIEDHIIGRSKILDVLVPGIELLE